MSIATRIYLFALAITLVAEAPVVWLGYRRRVVPRFRIAAVFLAANLFTHGLLWTLWSDLPGTYAIRVAVAEIGVWLVEAAIYRTLLGQSLRRAVLVSLIANALSTGLGLLMWRWIYAHGGFENFR